MEIWADFGGKVYHLVRATSEGDVTICGIPLNTANGTTASGQQVPWIVRRKPSKRLCKCCSKQPRSTES